jgi:hypothetical protein
MSIFDIFKPQWEKRFDDLLENHQKALEAYLKGEYVVYPDMRIDDRLLIKEYMTTYEKANYPKSIEELTTNDKKELVSYSDDIIRVYRAFAKYDTKQKRVKSLMERFRNDNVFNSVFGNNDYLGNNWSVDSLDDFQLDFILNKYQWLVDKASKIKEDKEKRLAGQRRKLLERVYIKQADQLIKKQKESDAVLSINNINPEIVKVLRNKVKELRNKYNSFNVYALIKRVLLLGFEDYSEISKDIFVLSRENVFDEGYKAFQSTKGSIRRQKSLTRYLQSTQDRDRCINAFILDHEYSILDEYIEDSSSSASVFDIDENIPKQEEKIPTNKIIFDSPLNMEKNPVQTVKDFAAQDSKESESVIDFSSWQARQQSFNNCLEYWQTELHGFTFLKPFTTVKAVVDSKSVVKHLNYIQIVKYLYSYPCDDNHYMDSKNFTKVQKLNNFAIRFSQTDPSTLSEIISFIDKIDGELDSLSIVLGTNGVDDPFTYYYIHTKKLLEYFRAYYTNCVFFNQIEKLEDPKNIIIIELVSDKKTSRIERKKILEKFPGTAIGYLSIYKEQ